MTDWEDIAVRWSVRVALALYAAALLLRIRGGNGRVARTLWSAGYVAFLLHLAAAFHFVHGWSHDAAYESTARRTFDMIGSAWGGGVYANYGFALIWGIDAAWWWLWPTSYERRPRWLEYAVQGFLAFIAFNSTVVFGVGWIRWAGAAVSLIFIVAIVAVIPLRSSSTRKPR